MGACLREVSRISCEAKIIKGGWDSRCLAQDHYWKILQSPLHGTVVSIPDFFFLDCLLPSNEISTWDASLLTYSTDTMTKAAYNRKHLIGGFLIVSESYFIIIIIGIIATGSQTWHWSSSWEFISDLQAHGRNKAGLWDFKTHPQRYNSSNKVTPITF